MKKLNDDDIMAMLGDEFVPQTDNVRRSVRTQLHIRTRFPDNDDTYVPETATLDLHQRTEQESWDAIMTLAQSGVKTAKIITGASGILKIKFQQWANDSILSPYIISYTPINNGSFFVRFRKMKTE